MFGFDARDATMTTPAPDTYNQIPSSLILGNVAPYNWENDAIQAFNRRLVKRGFSISEHSSFRKTGIVLQDKYWEIKYKDILVGTFEFTRARSHRLRKLCVTSAIPGLILKSRPTFEEHDRVKRWMMIANMGKKHPSTAKFAAIVSKRFLADLAIAVEIMADYIHNI